MKILCLLIGHRCKVCRADIPEACTFEGLAEAMHPWCPMWPVWKLVGWYARLHESLPRRMATYKMTWYTSQHAGFRRGPPARFGAKIIDDNGVYWGRWIGRSVNLAVDYIWCARMPEFLREDPDGYVMFHQKRYDEVAKCPQ